MADETPAFDRLGVGSRLAGYRLDEQIGRGGMAVVYRAYDTRLERPVAIKVLTPELAEDEAFRQRFIRESRTAAAVDHPNIIPIFEAGEAGGVLFIAMRFVQGPNVQALVETTGPAAAARVGFWLLEIPLAYALAVPFHFRANGAYFAIVIAEAAIAAAGILLFRRGRWKRQQI